MSALGSRAVVAAAVVLTHPRHVALFAFVTGLTLSRAPRVAVALAAAGATAAVLAAGVASRSPSWPAGVLGELAGARAGPLAAGVALAVFAGAVAGEARLRALDGSRLTARAGQSLTVTATVLEPVRRRAGGPAVARVRLDGSGLTGESAVMRARGTSAEGPPPQVGEIVVLAGRVAPLGPYDAYQRPRGAAAALEVASMRRTGRRRGGIAGALDAVRRRAERGLEHGLRRDDANLLRGMVLGQDERLAEEVRDDFRRSGLAHLLAVSGQNVMLLAILVLAFSVAVGLPLRARLLLALLLVAAYVPLAGGGPSIQRAGVMGAAGLVAALAGRPASRWYALGLAAAATLALNPLAVLEPGWQLSFAAVLALLALCPPLRELLARSMPSPVADATAITLAATVGTAPLMALHFEQLSLASLPANLLAAPAVAPVMWLGMLSAAAAQVSPVLAAPFNALDGPLLGYLTWLARVAADAPLAVLPVRIGSASWLLAAALVPVVLTAAAHAAVRRLPPAGLRTRRPGRRLAVALLVAGLVGAVAVREARPGFRAGPGELTVSFLDVGQGDATLIQAGDGSALLFDGGPPEAAVHRAVRAAGVRRLDLVVATHQSRDHQGGLAAVVERFETRMLLENGEGTRDPDFRRLLAVAAVRGVERVPARAGQVLRIGALVVRVLAPAPLPPGVPAPEDPNPRGVAAIVSAGDFDLWLSADAESAAILPLPLREVEAMKVSHHGSADPGLPAVLERLKPQVAAIQVGAGNDYGHPAPSTLSALRAAVPNVYRTDRDGTVVLRVANGRMTVTRDA